MFAEYLPQHLVRPSSGYEELIQMKKNRIAVGRNFSLGGFMREGRCCDHRKFPRTCLFGNRLSWPTLAKAKSGLVLTFHR